MHPYAEKLLDRTPPRLRPAVRLTLRTGEGAADDRLPGLAAEISFWSLVSLPALAIAALATTTMVLDRDGGELRDEVLATLLDIARVALTSEAIDSAARPALELLLDTSGAGVVSFAFVTALWTASRAAKVALTTLALTYDRERLRSGWQTRILAFGLTLAGIAVAAVLAPLLIAGPGFGATLVDWIGSDPIGIATIWRAVYWPATVLFATLVIALLFHIGVPGWTPWLRDLPGAALTTSVWLIGSVGLRWYASSVLGDDGGAYGPLAGPIVVLLWMWVTGFAVLLGAEFNAQIEKTWPSRRRRSSDRSDQGQAHRADDRSADRSADDRSAGGRSAGGRSSHRASDRDRREPAEDPTGPEPQEAC